MIGYLRAWRGLTMDYQAVTAMEYGLIVGAIAVVIVASVHTLGSNLSAMFTNLAGDL